MKHGPKMKAHEGVSCMRRILLHLAVFLLPWSCRATLKPMAMTAMDGTDAPPVKHVSVGIGDGFQCVADKRAKGLCVDTKSAAWQTLRAAGIVPTVRSILAQD